MFPLPTHPPILFEDPERSPEETAFLQSIADDPDDDTARLVFADWLEEQGHSAKAAFVRLEVEANRLPRSDDTYEPLCAELEGMGEVVGWRWAFALTRPARLLNCGASTDRNPAVRFAYQCPNRWADLTPTADNVIRHCEQCGKNVYACASKEEAEQHALQGHCIAICSKLAMLVEESWLETTSEVNREVIGIPRSSVEEWAEHVFARRGKRWWQFWR